MKLKRIWPATALTAGLALTAGAQTPDTTKPATPAASTPSAPDTKADFEKADEALRAGKIDEAIKHLEAAGKKDPKLPPPLVLLSRFAAAANNGQAARQFVERAGATDPDHPSPYLLSGEYALAEGRIMDAMLCFETALSKAGSTRWDLEAQRLFTKASREGLARTYANRGESAKAVQQLQALLKDDPKNALIRVQIAQAYFGAKQFDSALAEFKQAFTDDKDNPRIGLPETNMGNLYSQFGADDAERAKNKGTAEEWHKKALEAYKGDVRAAREYGRWLINEGRLDDADKQLAAAKGIKGDDNETNALIGLAHRYRKQYKEAEAIFDNLNRLERTNPFYAWNLALVMAESGDKSKQEQAVAIAQLAQSTMQRNAEAFAVLGWCLYKAGRQDDAEKALNASVQASGGQLSPDTIYFLSRLLDYRAKGPDARDALKKALESKGPFVYRADAQGFYDELVKKHGEKKEEPKKDEPKK